MRAARYLGVPPWVLAEQSVAWREWALLAEQAEGKAEANSLKRSTNRPHSPF